MLDQMFSTGIRRASTVSHNATEDVQHLCTEAEEEAIHALHSVEAEALNVLHEVGGDMHSMLSLINPALDQGEEGKEGDIHGEHVANLRRSLTGATLDEEELFHLRHDRIVHTVWFNVSVNALTVMNALEMGVEADHPDWTTVWMICENIFTAGFAVEMIIKLCVLRRRYFKDYANWLDGSLTCLGIIDCWILSLLGNSVDLQSLSILRILRLLRLARVLKLVRSFKPFVLVIRGVMRAVSTSFYVFLMLLFILYIFAIFFTEHLGRGHTDLYPGYTPVSDEMDEQELMQNFNPYICFGSVTYSMFTLFNMAIMAEWTEIVRPIAIKQPEFVLPCIVFAMLVAFGVMNVMIGMIVDSVSEESKRIDSDIDARIKKEKMNTLDKIQGILNEMDTNGDGVLDVYELNDAMKHHPEFMSLLKNINVPSGWSADEFVAMLDNSGDGNLQKDEFTTSFFRLMDSDDFQQICIMQAGMNQTRIKINELIDMSSTLQSGFSTMQADIRSLKSVICPPAEGKAQPSTEVKEQPVKDERPSEVVGEVREELCEQRSSNQSREPMKGTESAAYQSEGCTESVSMDLKERLEHVSHEQLTETLDAAYSVMKESFRRELASMNPATEAKLRGYVPEYKESFHTEFANLRSSFETKLTTPECLSTAQINSCSFVSQAIKAQGGDCRQNTVWDSSSLQRDGAEESTVHMKACNSSDEAGNCQLYTTLDSSSLNFDYATGGTAHTSSRNFTDEALGTQGGNCQLNTALDSLHVNGDDAHKGIAYIDQVSSIPNTALDKGNAADDCAQTGDDFESVVSLGRAGYTGADADFEAQTSAFQSTCDEEAAGTATLGESPDWPDDIINQHTNPAVIHEFLFEDHAPLGFEILWVSENPPVVGRVWHESAAERCGVLSGDQIAWCNGLSAQGRRRDEMLSQLRLRPLLLKMLRAVH